ncbi:hypothetical protein ACMZ5C_20275, partial [Acinetobacter baumannii]
EVSRRQRQMCIRDRDQYEEKLDVKNIAHAQDMRNRMNKVEQIILGPYRDELIKSININL